MSNILTKDFIINSCTGCGICAAVCPVNAIEINLDCNGFYKPEIDDEECIDCGKCVKICYKYDGTYCKDDVSDIESKYKCYSAKNVDKNELLNSSSGAVSIELMRYCISSGFKVLGVAYDYDKDRAVTKIASTYEEIEEFRGSKYFQSYTVDAFRQVISDKSDQKYAIFGTPCQIYGFSRYAELNHISDRYLLVDCFCHGCPSLLLWKKYLSEIKNENSWDSFDRIVFRSKTHKWHEFCFDFISEGNKVTSSRYSDSFYDLFFSNLMLNDSCYDCVARGSLDRCDIRLGDFWGDRYDMDEEGVSAVVLCSERGKDIFYHIKDRFYSSDVSLKEVIKAQSFGTDYGIDSSTRMEAYEKLHEDKSLSSIVKDERKLLSLKKRLRIFISRIMKFCPRFIYTRIKRLVHKI